MANQSATTIPPPLIESNERLNQRLNLALTASNVGVWEFNLVDGSLFWDERMYKLHGITPDTFAGAYESWENCVHRDDLEMARENLQDAISGVKKFDTEFRITWPNGEIRNIRALGDVSLDEYGQPSSMCGVNWDITKQKKMQQVMVEKNNDLQHFTHIAAHDLREPCRRLQAMSNLVLEDYADSVPEEVSQVLSQIAQQAAQMSSMVDSFRALTNVGAQPVSADQCKMEEVIRTVLSEFTTELKDARVELELDYSFSGYPNLIQIMLRNIISNAVKYGSPGMKLSFSSEILEGKTTVAIENTSDYVISEPTKLFHPFVRENSQHDGQGIGLSICKRVIDMHGGSIWAEPKEGLFCIKFQLENTHEH